MVEKWSGFIEKGNEIGIEERHRNKYGTVIEDRDKRDDRKLQLSQLEYKVSPIHAKQSYRPFHFIYTTLTSSGRLIL